MSIKSCAGARRSRRFTLEFQGVAKQPAIEAAHRFRPHAVGARIADLGPLHFGSEAALNAALPLIGETRIS